MKKIASSLLLSVYARIPASIVRKKAVDELVVSVLSRMSTNGASWSSEALDCEDAAHTPDTSLTTDTTGADLAGANSRVVL